MSSAINLTQTRPHAETVRNVNEIQPFTDLGPVPGLATVLCGVTITPDQLHRATGCGAGTSTARARADVVHNLPARWQVGAPASSHDAVKLSSRGCGTGHSPTAAEY